MNRIPIFLKNEKGIALVVALLFLTLLSLLGIAGIITSSTDTKIASNTLFSTKAFYAAEAGIEYGFVKLRDTLQVSNPTINITAPAIAGYTFNEYSVAAEGTQQTAVIGGTFAGLTAYVTNYRITSSALMGGTNAVAKIELLVKDELIPVFQFGIFFQNDLEILPGSNMTFSGGKIHSNSDIYVSTNATLSIDSKITSAGDIIKGRKDSSTPGSGTVRIKDQNGNYQNMTIDSNSPNWASDSQTIWGGNVKSEDHGVETLNVPTATGNPIDLIGTGTDSMYQKAGLRIIDGVAKNKDGNTIEIRYYNASYTNPDGTLKIDPGGTAALNVNPLATNSFTDKRENEVVTVTEVNIAKLQNSTNAMNALNSPPSGSDPNILYITQTDNSKSVRLTDGGSIPASGLTVASNNPVYIKGDYNTANNPAAVISDAVTVLSNSWNDANSSSSNLNDRTASDTTVKAAFMGGNRNTSGSQYSGGAENFIRFLENWTGRTFTYSGSLVCLWESQQATGNWIYGSPVYTAPTRNWSYGINPASLPPGTPRVRNVERVAWRQITY